MRSDLPGPHCGQQQGGQLDAQHHGDGQNQRQQARGAEEIAVHQDQFHVSETKSGGMAHQRLYNHEIRRQTPADVAAPLDNWFVKLNFLVTIFLYRNSPYE